jgi:hypothetical protein
LFQTRALAISPEPSMQLCQPCGNIARRNTRAHNTRAHFSLFGDSELKTSNILLGDHTMRAFARAGLGTILSMITIAAAAQEPLVISPVPLKEPAPSANPLQGGGNQRGDEAAGMPAPRLGITGAPQPKRPRAAPARNAIPAARTDAPTAAAPDPASVEPELFVASDAAQTPNRASGASAPTRARSRAAEATARAAPADSVSRPNQLGDGRTGRIVKPYPGLFSWDER